MEPRRRLSVVRLLVLLLVVSGLGLLGWSQGTQAYQRITATPSSTWFAPYEDVTLTPEYHFEDPTVNPSLTQVLGFVVADPKNACAPTWGTYYDLAGAGSALDLDRRIMRLRERGGDAIVSFGGEANQELATTCSDPSKLVAAYRSVIARYHSRIVDFDIEGAALSDTLSNERRARAIRVLQQSTSAKNRLRVWLTLPVTPAGLTADGVNTVSAMVRAGDRLDGINVMAMDFGGSLPAGQSMRTGVEHSLVATEKQLAAIWRQAGVVMTPQQVWQHLGVTPMIGRNDVAGETFSLGDAHALVSFARRMHLGRVSIWSANRDSQCGVQSIDGQVSNTCSGISQKPLAFTWELGRLNGKPPVRATAPAPADPAALPTRDDPATSPYAIWRATKTYRVGDEIVWHQRVYEAKWFTSGYSPDTPVKHLWDTPWRYIGPVLASDAAPARAAASKLRGWTADGVYLAGTQVLFRGLVYEAKWWTQADTPSRAPAQPSSMPWKVIGVETAAQASAASLGDVPDGSATPTTTTPTTDTTTTTPDASSPSGPSK